MKSRPKIRIDETDRNDMIMVQGLFGFLAELTDIKVIYDEACRIDEEIDQYFCSQCECDKENCECARQSYWERDWDYHDDDF